MMINYNKKGSEKVYRMRKKLGREIDVGDNIKHRKWSEIVENRVREQNRIRNLRVKLQ